MGTYLQRTFMCLITSIFLTSSSAILYANGDCSYSNCATNIYSKNPIPFPFRTPDQPSSCGLPGFDLVCNDSTRTPLLSFPSGQSFTVDWISDSLREIRISGGGCFPEKLLRFNSSGTPFRAMKSTLLTLFSCPSETHVPYTRFDPCREIVCANKRRYNPVVCDAYTGYRDHRLLLNAGCNMTGGVRVPGSWGSAYTFGPPSSVYLTWDTPRECLRCDSIGHVCRCDPLDYNNIKCFRKSRDISKLIASLVVPPIVFAIVYTCYVCCRQIQRRNRHPTAVVGNAATRLRQVYGEPLHVNTTNQGSNVTSAIEQATLNTYPILIVGESGRILINMEDKICSICLSDYEPGDVLKLLPECLHRFHSDCIDEWLRAQATCPICRNLPPRTSNA